MGVGPAEEIALSAFVGSHLGRPVRRCRQRRGRAVRFQVLKKHRAELVERHRREAFRKTHGVRWSQEVEQAE